MMIRNMLAAQKHLIIPQLAALIVLAAAPAYSSTFTLILMSKALVMAILVLGFNVLFGYTGLLSLGHAMFFGTGAYITAYLSVRLGVKSIEALLPLSVVGATLLALPVGIISVRYTKIHFVMLTFAFAQVLYGIVLKFYKITGGTDGIGPVFGVTFMGIPLSMRSLTLFYFILAVFLISAIIIWLIVNSHFGKTIQSIRENSVRAEYIGIPVIRYRWYAFIISAIFGGVAGSLWAPLTGHIAPDSLFWLLSADIIFIALIGGHRSFLGPVIGSFIFVFLQNYLIGITEYWLLPMGLLLVLILVFARGGVAGLFKKLLSRGNRRRARNASFADNKS